MYRFTPLLWMFCYLFHQSSGWPSFNHNISKWSVEYGLVDPTVICCTAGMVFSVDQAWLKFDGQGFLKELCWCMESQLERGCADCLVHEVTFFILLATTLCICSWVLCVILIIHGNLPFGSSPTLSKGPIVSIMQYDCVAFYWTQRVDSYGCNNRLHSVTQAWSCVVCHCLLGFHFRHLQLLYDYLLCP